MIEALKLAVLVYIAGSLIALCILSFRAFFIWKSPGNFKPRASQLILVALCTSWLYVFDIVSYTLRNSINKIRK